jgi:hypothetical protein
VGSPYHLSRGDIGNQKGIYTMDVETGTLDFIPNTYSPVFQKIEIEKFVNMSPQEQNKALFGNYTDIMVNESDEHKYKMADIREILSKSGAKRADIQSVRQKTQKQEEEGEEVHEQHSVEALIEISIDSLEGFDDEYKAELKNISRGYISAATAEIAAEA